ncbi:MAG: T9SS type A sorting domain-containing protein [Cytophagales bacterium]|nr:T9SS type A sorting domain-containing protein [Cytophagales bacterium]
MRVFLFVTAFLISFTNWAQEHKRCATHSHIDSLFEQRLQQIIKYHKSAKTTEIESILTIPVVVHVVHSRFDGQIGGFNNNNISVAQIESQIAVLNKDFRRLNSDTLNTPQEFRDVAVDTHIEFCLASRAPDGSPTNGITRTYSSNLPFDAFSFQDEKNLKSLAYWDASQYLNIWVTELADNTLGFARFPSNSSLLGLRANESTAELDGVVIHHRNFGDRIGTSTLGFYNEGRTATHEVGHWLGLLHLWGDFETCNADDYCIDTPTQEAPNYGCTTDAFSCGTTDMSMNYMDYANDACMNLFTALQKERMWAALEASPRRKALFSSLGCCGVKNTYSLPFVEDFSENLVDRGWETDTTQDNISLISPHFNTKGLEEVHVQFDANSQEDIIVLYELNCNEMWDTLFVHSSTSSSWETVIKLASVLDNQSAIRLQFLFNSNTQFDYIELYSQSDALDFIAYPNPLDQPNLTIKTKLTGIHNIQVEIFNNLGAKVEEITNQEVIGDEFTIPSLYLPKGFYIIRLSYEGNSYSQPFIVTQ